MRVALALRAQLPPRVRRDAAPVPPDPADGAAAALLRATDHSVARICAEVGLASVGSFTTSFKRIYGCTPTTYRRAHPPAADLAPIPSCALMAWTRPRSRATSEKTDPAAAGSVAGVR